MKKLLVKIVKSDKSSYWYDGRIGETFEVVEAPNCKDEYFVFDGEILPTKLIQKNSCEIVQDLGEVTDIAVIAWIEETIWVFYLDGRPFDNWKELEPV